MIAILLIEILLTKEIVMNNLWSTAEFSKLTGLSIRALHYYDEEGVLIPHHKNEKGFRYYSHEDFLLAQKITTLKYVGFNLNQIKKILLNPDFDLLGSLRLQANALREGVAQMNKGLIVVEESIKHYTISGEIDWLRLSRVLKTFKISHSDFGKEWAERNFSVEERKFFGEKKFQKIKINYERLWADIFTEAKRFMLEGKDPLSDEVQLLAQKGIDLWAELSRKQYPNNPELANKMWELMKDGDIPDDLIAGYDHKVILYFNEAMEYRESLIL